MPGWHRAFARLEGSVERVLKAGSRAPRWANESSRIIARLAQWTLCGKATFRETGTPDSASFDQFLVNLLTRLTAYSAFGRGISQTHGVLPRCGKLLFLSRVYCLLPLLRKPIPTIIGIITSLIGINT
jgi:hypothetical protein